MITNVTRRFVSHLVWPPSRAIAAGLAWTHRHTVAMWARSIAAEVRRRPFDPKRLAALLRVLWKASTDARLKGAGSIRTLTVDNDVLGEGDQSYRAATVRAALLDVPGVVAVEVTEVPTVEPVLIDG